MNNFPKATVSNKNITEQKTSDLESNKEINIRENDEIEALRETTNREEPRKGGIANEILKYKILQ